MCFLIYDFNIQLFSFFEKANAEPLKMDLKKKITPVKSPEKTGDGLVDNLGGSLAKLAFMILNSRPYFLYQLNV